MKKYVLWRVLPASVLVLALALGSVFIDFVQAANTHSIDLERSSSQYLSVADNAALSITGDLTIEAWVKFESFPSAGTGEQYIIAGKFMVDTGVDQRSYYLAYGDTAGTNKLKFQISSDGTSANTTLGTINWSPSTGTWYHLAAAYTASSGQVEFFVNGSSLGTASGLKTSIHDGTAGFRIGSNDISGFADGFDGLIDDVRVWNITRTGTEISDDRSRELYGNETGLVGYWKLNNSLNDITDNNSDLTNNGSALFSTDSPFPGFTEILKVRKSIDESLTNSTLLQNDDEPNYSHLKWEFV